MHSKKIKSWASRVGLNKMCLSMCMWPAFWLQSTVSSYAGGFQKLRSGHCVPTRSLLTHASQLAHSPLKIFEETASVRSCCPLVTQSLSRQNSLHLPYPWLLLGAGCCHTNLFGLRAGCESQRPWTICSPSLIFFGEEKSHQMFGWIYE